MSIETHLVKKTATSQTVCNRCNKSISSGEVYHREEGVNQHLHSLIARSFCTNCYAKYGEPSLLSKE